MSPRELEAPRPTHCLVVAANGHTALQHSAVSAVWLHSTPRGTLYLAIRLALFGSCEPPGGPGRELCSENP